MTLYSSLMPETQSSSLLQSLGSPLPWGPRGGLINSLFPSILSFKHPCIGEGGEWRPSPPSDTQVCLGGYPFCTM